MMFKLLFALVYFLIVVLLSVPNILCNKVATCPTPSVKKRTVIQSKESIKNGAEIITRKIVNNAKDCYELCCDDLNCNIALMHYKEERSGYSNELITKKWCYLFSCGYPSRCTYGYHRRYAVIDLGSRRDELEEEDEEDSIPKPKPSTTTAHINRETTTRTAIDIENAVSSTASTKRLSTGEPAKSASADPCMFACGFNYEPVCGDDKETYSNRCLFKLAKCKNPSLKLAYDGECGECPPGVPVASCTDDPCNMTICPANKNAVCKANFCGGCNAVYYDDSSKKVNCSIPGVCQIQLSRTVKGSLGAHIPQCNSDGTYKEKQCHGSTGYCWCVNPENGTEIEGTKKGPAEGEVKCGTCKIKLASMSNGLLGAHIPQCKSDGTYEDKQCDGSTGYCWCVDSETGIEVKGTKKGPGKGEVKCGTCDIKLASVPNGMLGAYTPQCKSDGTYEEKQCHGSTGYCWCVDSETGIEVKGTKKSPSEGEVQCDVGISHNEEAVTVNTNDYEEPTEEESLSPDQTEDPYFTTERRKWINGSLGACHAKLSSIPSGLVGAYYPQCKSDGTFKEKQCHSSTGYCWCVNSESGTELEGTKKGPAEGAQDVTCKPTSDTPAVVVVVKGNAVGSYLSLPLLVALIICIVLLVGIIYRVKCVRRGRAKKLPVDDGDYLINGMYL